MVRVSPQLELEEALRRALLAVEDERARYLDVRAQLHAVVGVLGRRLGELAPAAEAALEQELAEHTDRHRAAYREADMFGAGRLQVGDAVDKYQISNDDGPPCLELLPICHGRCCQFDMPLSTQDLDEGVIQWDRAQPYLIRHEADGFCTHFDRGSRGCGAYHHRPGPCRTFDCRKDPRIWIDFEARHLAPPGVPDPEAWQTNFNLLDRVERREAGLAAERAALAAHVPTAPTAAPYGDELVRSG